MPVRGSEASVLRLRDAPGAPGERPPRVIRAGGREEGVQPLVSGDVRHHGRQEGKGQFTLCDTTFLGRLRGR